MPLLLFVTVAPDGRSVLLGFALINTESSSDIVWASEHMRSLLGHQPEVILTDEHASFPDAIDTAFGSGTRHHLCLWHLPRSVQKKLMEKIKGNFMLFVFLFFIYFFIFFSPSFVLFFVKFLVLQTILLARNYTNCL
jgi:transposase-like protein